MTMEDELRAADQRRRQAMIDADVNALEALLADELVWTHSSGKKDRKPAFLEKIAANAADYRSLEVSEDTVARYGDLFIHHGDLSGQVVVDGREKSLNNRFLAVWKRSGGGFQLIAWQSTGF